MSLTFSYGSPSSTSTCTNIFTTEPTPTGATILTSVLTNTTPSAGDYIQMSVGTANMADGKRYVRIYYKE